MNPPNPKGLLVVFTRQYSRQTGTAVEVLDSAHPDFVHEPPEGRWVVRCRAHGCSTSTVRLSDVHRLMPRPADWCSECALLLAEGLKLCQNCGVAKDKDVDFYRRSDGSNPKSWCIPCYCARTNEYRIRADFGLTSAEYAAMFVAQGNGCAICRREERKQRNGNPIRLAVDHDHSTGQVRGLLCDRCNRFLGAMEDSVELLTAAISYLTHHRSIENPRIVPTHVGPVV